MPCTKATADLPAGDFRVGQAVIDYGSTLVASGDHTAGERVLRHALVLETRAVEAGHWRIARAQIVLGLCLARQRRFAEGEPLLRTAFEMIRGLGMADPNVRSHALAIADFYTRWNRPVQADSFRALVH